MKDELLKALENLDNLTNIPEFRRAANMAGYMAQFSTAKDAARKAIRNAEKEQADPYIESGGNHCPNCGSDNITGTGDHETDDGVHTMGVKCQHCKTYWTEIYRLVSWNYD